MPVCEFCSNDLFFDNTSNKKLIVLPPQILDDKLLLINLNNLRAIKSCVFCLQHFNILNTLHHFISHICLYIEGI